MLKSFNELSKVDVTPYIEKRDGADYISWTSVVKLLHEHGAQKVWWDTIQSPSGHSIFMTDQVFVDKNGKTNRCYEIRVRLQVDDDEFTYTYPIMNGIHPVKDDLMNQVAVEKAKQRALVKAVDIRYGLGFNVWAKDEIDDDSDDLYKHNLKSIEERVQQIYTRLIRKGMTTNEIAQALNKTPDEVKTIFTFFAQLDRFEQDLTKLL
jgi:hypothetical protein